MRSEIIMNGVDRFLDLIWLLDWLINLSMIQYLLHLLHNIILNMIREDSRIYFFPYLIYRGKYKRMSFSFDNLFSNLAYKYSTIYSIILMRALRVEISLPRRSINTTRVLLVLLLLLLLLLLACGLVIQFSISSQTAKLKWSLWGILSKCSIFLWLFLITTKVQWPTPL